MPNPILQMLGGNNSGISMLLELMMNNQSPQQMLSVIAQQNPEAMTVLQSLGRNATPQDMSNLCRTLCQQRGLNYEQICSQAQQILKQNNIRMR